MSIPPLDGIRVLDLTHHVSGPFCTKMLADFGADVIKIERPGSGDPARRMGPFHEDDPHPEKSGLFLHLNTNKRSVTLDLKTTTGQRILKRLAERVDVVAESFRPGTMARLGLDYTALEAVNPRAVMISLSNFGQTGPYRDMKGTELTLFAMGGPMKATGSSEREPLKLAGHVALCHAGATAAFATTMAVYAAEDDGEGQHVDISIYETQAGSRDRRTTMLTAFQYTGETTRRAVNTAFRLASGVRPCADGYVNLIGAGPWFPNVARMIGREDLLQEEMFATPEARMKPEAAEAFDEVLIPWLMERNRAEIVAEAQKHRILSAPIHAMEDLLHDRHMSDRNVWDDIDHPHTGTVRFPGRPFVMSDSPRPDARRAPLLGEHNEEVLCGELGYTRRDLVVLRGQGVI